VEIRTNNKINSRDFFFIFPFYLSYLLIYPFGYLSKAPFYKDAYFYFFSHFLTFFTYSRRYDLIVILNDV